MKLDSRFGRTAPQFPAVRRAPFARPHATLRHAAGRAVARLIRGLVARVAAWPLSKPLARVVLIASGLVLLAWVGHSSFVRRVLARGSPEIPPATSSFIAPSPDALDGSALSPAVAASSPSAAGPTTGPSAEPAHTPSVASPSGARARATPEDPVYLNRATLEDLMRLPGVGAKRGQAVLALRAKLGKLRQLEDLMRVKGIGRATLKRLRPLVRLEGGPDTLANPAANSPASANVTPPPP